MPKISLTIKNAGKTIDGPLENRPLRISPTGIACAVYRGKVYPIYEDQSIDVTDTPWEKEECEVAKPGVRPPYVQRQKEIQGALQTRALPQKWNVESNAYGLYFVFDGNQSLLENLLDAFETSDIVVRRYDRSVRPAFDGYQYDWFIRLDFDGSREDCIEAIKESLNYSAPSQQTRNDTFEEHFKEIASLFAKKLEGEREQFRTAIEKQKIDFLKERASLKKEINLLEERIVSNEEQYKRRLKNAPFEPPLAQSKEAALLEDLQRVQQERDSVKKAHTELENAYCDLDDQYRQEVTLNTELKSRLSEKENTLLIPPPPASRKGKKHLENFIFSLLKSLYPNLHFDDDSAEAVEAHYTGNFKPLFDILRGLDQKEAPLKRCGGCQDTFELDKHISTGADNRGRIYVRKKLSPDNHYVAFIRWKQDDKSQEREIRKIESLPKL